MKIDQIRIRIYELKLQIKKTKNEKKQIFRTKMIK